MVEVRNLAYRIDGKEVFSSLDFKIESGEKKLLIGKNGSGKSSLLGILQGFLSPSEGEVLKPKELKSTYLFQDTLNQFIAPIALEDVAFSLIAKEKYTQENALNQAREILKRLEIPHLAQNSIFSLSGGEKRLIALAGVLVCECDLYLLDEPFNELDQKRCEIVKEIILEKKGACLIASHQILDWKNQLKL
ncbi:ABC transporter ATP-binding protein [Helicobacter pylori]